jgi:hypothetical protein
MKALPETLRALLHLFIEDGSLTILVVTSVLVSAIVIHFLPARPLVGGIVLLAGCLLSLLGNVLTASGRT